MQGSVAVGSPVSPDIPFSRGRFMASQTVPPFNDPKLKDALRRAFGREVAPSGLRERVIAALDRSDATGTGHAGPQLRITEPFQPEDLAAQREARRASLVRHPLIKLAIAASIVLVVGITAMQLMTGPSGQTGTKLAVLPKPFAEAMVQSHEAQIAKMASSAVSIARSDLPAAAKKLSDQLGYPVLAPALPSEWTARDAGVTTVNQVQVAQVTYTRGARSVSLFSLPANKVYSPEEGATYELTHDRHAIAGFVRNKVMYCVVGDEQTSLADLKQLGQALQSN
jgi:hypothetical protein